VAEADEAALDDAVAATGFADLPLPLTAPAIMPITKMAAMARRMTFRLP
jgi:hypothetical protein